jgi:hypothetical protein
MTSLLRRAARITAAVVAALLIPAGASAASAGATFDALYAPGPERAVPAASPVPHDPAKPTAVVVVGERGAVVSDVLAPYEVLAATGRFNLYTVAPLRRPVTLTGGLDLVPDLTDFERRYAHEMSIAAATLDLTGVLAVLDTFRTIAEITQRQGPEAHQHMLDQIDRIQRGDHVATVPGNDHKAEIGRRPGR